MVLTPFSSDADAFQKKPAAFVGQEWELLYFGKGMPTRIQRAGDCGVPLGIQGYALCCELSGTNRNADFKSPLRSLARWIVNAISLPLFPECLAIYGRGKAPTARRQTCEMRHTIPVCDGLRVNCVIQFRVVWVVRCAKVHLRGDTGYPDFKPSAIRSNSGRSNRTGTPAAGLPSIKATTSRSPPFFVITKS